MSRIVVLKPHIANQIAAGEVVERPASIVKELVENAIDAGATAITIEIEGGGIDRIRVADNGAGIPATDCLLAFERHATSKLSAAEDLQHIETLGFRGEALASIAAVAQVRLTTRTADEESGTLLRIEAGECQEHRPYGCPEGTALEVANLFYNIPARRRFLKAARTEASHIADYLSRMILARPDISFKYTNNAALVYHSPGDDLLRNAIYCVYGAETLPHLRELLFDDGYIRITGYLGTAEIARPNRVAQSFLVNGRYIRSGLLSAALQRAYGSRLMGGRFPFAVVAIRIASGEVDVNVHPNKLEVRFVNETRVENALLHAAETALAASAAPTMQWPEAKAPPAKREAPPTKPLPPIAPVISQSPDCEKPPISTPLPDLTQRPKPAARLREGAFSARPWERAPVSAAMREAGERLGKEPVPEFKILSAHSAQQAWAAEQSKPPERQEAFGFAPYAIAGQVFDSYWIVQQGEDLFFIDQHAAHERILYERFMAREPEAAAQQLLTPETLALSPEEYESFERNAALLEELGFAVRAIGPLAIQIDAIPALFGSCSAATLLREALALPQDRGNANALRREKIIQAACKHAVKAGDPLTKSEIEGLLAAFHRDGMPMTCPHGRPVMIRMSRRELEKQFKRII